MNSDWFITEFAPVVIYSWSYDFILGIGFLMVI